MYTSEEIERERDRYVSLKFMIFHGMLSAIDVYGGIFYMLCFQNSLFNISFRSLLLEDELSRVCLVHT
jgi:hypothetical protein